MKNLTSETSHAVDGDYIPAEPPLIARKHVKLATVRDCRRETARLYNECRQGVIETGDLSRLVFALTSISKMIELETFETRLNALEKK